MLRRLSFRVDSPIIQSLSKVSIRTGGTILSTSSNGALAEQKRFKGIPAPQVFQRKGPHVGTEEQRQHAKRLDKILLGIHQTRQRAPLFGDDRDGYNLLLTTLHLACSDRTKSGPMDHGVFDGILKQYPNATMNSFLNVVEDLQRAPDVDSRRVSRRLLYSLSAAGVDEATLMIMNYVWLHASKREGILRSGNVQTERRRLQDIVRKGKNYRAMVLEAKLLRSSGNTSKAIELLERTIPWSAKIAKELNTANGLPIADKEAQMRVRGDKLELSSPYIELAMLYNDLCRSAKAGPARQKAWRAYTRATEIGMQQDDPLAYFWAARAASSEHPPDPNHPDQYKRSSKWLYYMSKAAASGMPEAAHELGEFYGSAEWKYLADEPPEHVKPTTFDTFPADSPADVWSRFLMATGLKPTITGPDDMFRVADFPADGRKRYLLAAFWLKVAAKSFYVPSILYLARMYLNPKIPAAFSMPKAALELQTGRYLYESAADHADAQFSNELKEYESRDEEPEMDNPLFNLKNAQECVREVFYAIRAAHIRAERMSVKASPRSQKQSNEPDFTGDNDPYVKASPAVRRFFAVPETFELWTKDINHWSGIARAMCDENAWDLYDEDDALIYRHKSTAV